MSSVASNEGSDVRSQSEARKVKQEFDMMAGFGRTHPICSHREEVNPVFFKQFPARAFNRTFSRVDHSTRNLKSDLPGAVAKLFYQNNFTGVSNANNVNPVWGVYYVEVMDGAVFGRYTVFLFR